MYTFFMAHPLVLGPPPPLQITSVVAGNVGANSAIVSWQTNNFADSRVDFGVTTPYSTVSNASAVSTHSLTLTGLTPTTSYHYQVTSVDVYAQSATSADATFTTTGAAMFDLSLSTAANRSAPAPLQGKTVSGTVYVFISPDSGVTQVRFYLDNPQRTGTPTRTEGLAPWDFAGTAGNGTAFAYGTTVLANGQHSITAAVDKSGGGTDLLTATFTVSNP
jgi:spore germination protein YaaH